MANEESGWRDIESAPDTGDYDFVQVSDGEYVTMARLYEGQWWELNNHPTDHWGGQLHPTHWQPLPPPPNV